MAVTSVAKLINYVDMYNTCNVSINGDSMSGEPKKFKSPSQKLPALISAIVASKQVGEIPTVKVGSAVIDSEVFDDAVRRLTYGLIAFGTVFVIPHLNDSDEIWYEICNVKDFKNLRYIEENGKLTYLRYNIQGESFDAVSGEIQKTNFKHEHYIHEGVYFYRVTNVLTNKYVDDLDGSTPINNDEMYPFIARLDSLSNETGSPLWAIAADNIKSVDKTFAEMNNQEELERRVVGIPAGMVRGMDADRLTKMGNRLPFLNDNYRGFVVMPSIDYDGEIRMGGDFNPDPYLTSVNHKLHQISMLVSLGARYFSYDKSGGLKTAKEVRFGENDLMLSQSLLNGAIKRSIVELARRHITLSSTIDVDFIPPNDIEVEFSDAVVNSLSDTLEKLSSDYVNGAIDRDTYIRESYKFISNIDVSDSSVEMIEPTPFEVV